MSQAQPGILAPIPAFGRYLLFAARPQAGQAAALTRLAALAEVDAMVVGLGPALVNRLGARIPGLRGFPDFSSPGLAIPATPHDLCCWLRSDERGELVHLSRRVEQALGQAFDLQHGVDAFRYGGGRDLTGYEDGTENPVGSAATATALVATQGPGLDGSSFLALQQWQHDFHAFDGMSGQQQDHAIGRRKSDNQELDDAPESAHVKRTAQESFDPEAFVLRRSMPWARDDDSGLMFAAFATSFDAYEAQMRRMVGADDGIRDGLFQFSRPINGSYFWCPPLRDGQLDLRAVGL
ncbi:Dyp-type peroxidase [Pseudomonas sp. N040]|uniref:Dyp-type peroxidase n=1 Tax=Pseudomonas sp. N040 TaxID=2785325 RepID=UPI0018A29FD0|nr:Dyp-type peroxidase [Pseudomonas sp. N040]MBF7731420.1 Dyp-type peroxidase [Pseudomonas sp. N040]MBW7015064.1 Dyp-type peroxidase [Pseudomonas sp. N040]